MAISKLLQTILVLSLIPAGAYAVATANNLSHTPASVGLNSLSITANGNATAIGSMEHADDSRPELSELGLPVLIPISDDLQIGPPSGEMSEASLSVDATVLRKNSSVVIQYSVSGGLLTIGETTYELVNGTGIFNQQSLVVVLHATVQSGDWTGTLILHGHTDQALTDPGSVSLNLDMPQSKLASRFFLELKGTLTLS